MTTCQIPNCKPRDYWQTPAWLLALVDEFYGAGQWFDPCPVNPTFDGLMLEWPPNTYINPPFSQYLKWVRHGIQQFGDQIWICHHDTSTERMKTLMDESTGLCLLNRRVSFIDPITGLPRGTDPAKSQTLIYIGCRPDDFAAVFSQVGYCYQEPAR